MNRDELMKKAKIVAMNWSHTTDPRSPSELLADFALGMYEAGQRAERERIADRIEDVMCVARSTGEFVVGLRSLMRELRSDPAESGE